MIDVNKTYSLAELLELYNMYNLDFKFYGNNKDGSLDVYMKTDIDKISVFTSTNSNISKYDYLKLNEEDAKRIEFKFDREVLDVDLDIVAIVLRTSDVNIPSGRYSLESLDKLVQEQDQEDRKNKKGLEDGICYLIVDNNTACTLYDGVYTFDKENKGLIEDLKVKYDEEESELLKNNLKMILDYCEKLKEKNSNKEL